MSDEDELIPEQTRISEITIQPDGRVYIFGASRQVMEVMEMLEPKESKIGRMMRRLRKLQRSEPSPLYSGERAG